MGLRFRRSFKLFPGVKVNLSKSGLSTSFGIPGASINVGSKGVRATVGLPGTGISYSSNLIPARSANSSPPNGAQYWIPSVQSLPGQGISPHHPISAPFIPTDGMNQISSAPVEWLTSDSLVDLKNMLVDAKRQRAQIREDLLAAKRELASRERELRFKNSFLRFMFKKRVPGLLNLVSELRKEIGELNGWNVATYVDITFETGAQVLSAYGALLRAYEACRTCHIIWDVTADQAVNQRLERTTASRSVDRRQVRFEFDDSDIVRFNGRAMRLSNANGDDLLLYPGLILIPRADGEFALLDFRDVELTATSVNFIETEGIPRDTKVVGQTWAKANKDGTPDRRFADNHQIPICEYGRLHFASKSGLNEEFQFSNSSAAIAFGHAFRALSTALTAQARAAKPN